MRDAVVAQRADLIQPAICFDSRLRAGRRWQSASRHVDEKAIAANGDRGIAAAPAAELESGPEDEEEETEEDEEVDSISTNRPKP